MSLCDDSTILVPVDVSDGNPPAQPLTDLCRSVDAILLGYYLVSDQVAPAQLRQDHGSDATAALAKVADEFRASDLDVTDVLVFTHDREDIIDRVADEYGCDAVLTLGESERIEQVFVPVRSETSLERIVSLLADLMQMMRALDVESRRFKAVSCTRCGYTEQYKRRQPEEALTLFLR